MVVGGPLRGGVALVPPVPLGTPGNVRLLPSVMGPVARGSSHAPWPAQISHALVDESMNRRARRRMLQPFERRRRINVFRCGWWAVLRRRQVLTGVKLGAPSTWR